MDDLMNKQREIAEQIIKNYNNFKKSPKDRLTKAYIETRCENLQVLWEKFMDSNFKIICLTKSTDKINFKLFSRRSVQHSGRLLLPI
ncbi:unnamed protein product [Euphydryas editha]|uniref:Uncharacterized protein n=1 Tax=Euphydryas editha TaxID=104508 RepID=A0AAU9TS97_EUPED|nr:unnamed protein product [Euphydryas editha]